MLRRQRHHDRSRLLSDAARAQRQGRPKKAVALYREILAVEPGDFDIHRRLAPVLARTRQREEAWASYRRAADGLVKQGFVERAIGVYREAAGLIPRECGVWLAIAELEVQRGRRPDALAALAAGRKHLRSRAERRDAIRLLERLRQLDPSALEAGLDLAGLLAKTGQRRRARELLAALARGTRGPELRRVRARELRLSPGPGGVWRWLIALAS